MYVSKLIVGGISMEEKSIVNDRSILFAQVNTECHYLKASEDTEEYLKVWVKEPTWLQVEQALSSVMKLDTESQSLDLDLNKMYKFMVENFIEKTEPSLSAVDLLRLSPYVGAQLKDILPNPFTEMLGDDTGNE